MKFLYSLLSPLGKVSTKLTIEVKMKEGQRLEMALT